MKDTKYRFFFGVFVGFILAGFFFFIFFYRGANAQPRPATPQPPTTASMSYELPPSYESAPGAALPNYTIAKYVRPAGISPTPVNYLDSANETAPLPAPEYVSPHDELVATYNSPHWYGYNSKPNGYYAYLRDEPPTVYVGPANELTPIYLTYAG